jgi:hypothetical protein
MNVANIDESDEKKRGLLHQQTLSWIQHTTLLN